MRIEVNNVYFTYAPKTPNAYEALMDICTRVEDGDFLTIVGQTGSGKSTLVQMLNGLSMPSQGSIIVDGDDTKVLCKKTKTTRLLRKKVGLVFQFPEYQLFEESILKDVAFGLINYGMKKEEAYEKAKQYILKVGLSESYFEKSPFELSGGEKRKVAIAGILALEPEILVLDEPTAGLDPKSKQDLLDLIEQLHGEGKTIILVTHNMTLVRKYATHVLLIEKGKVFFDGRANDFFTDEKVAEIIDVPEVIEFAKKLKAKGANIDIDKVTSVDTLVKQIKAWRGKDE